MSKTLYLLRHGDTGANGKLIGSTNVPVASKSFEQLANIRTALRDVEIGTVYCSPMLRCRQTADFVDLQRETIIIPSLREIDFGLWEELTFDEIAIKWPEQVKEWSKDHENFAFPGGEKFTFFLERVREVKRLIDECESEIILVVTHGGVIRHLICLYLGLSSHNYLLFDVKAGNLATIELYSDGGVLTALNQ